MGGEEARRGGAGGRAGGREGGRGARLLLRQCGALRLGRERRGEGGARVEQRVERREQLHRSRRVVGVGPGEGGVELERLRPNLRLPLQHKLLDGRPERRVVGGARGDAEAVERLEGGGVGEVARVPLRQRLGEDGRLLDEDDPGELARARRPLSAQPLGAEVGEGRRARALRRAAVAAGAAELRRLRRRRRRRAAAERRRRRRRRRRLRAALDGERRVVHSVGRRRRALGLARRLGGRLGGGRRRREARRAAEAAARARERGVGRQRIDP